MLFNDALALIQSGDAAGAREAFRAVAVPPRWSPAAPAPRRLVLLKPKTKESDAQVPTDELVAPLADELAFASALGVVWAQS